MKYYDIIIIGGGASGLAAAIEAARASNRLKIAVFEQLSRVGKKLLVTGNGRCNLGNYSVCAADYNNPDFAEPALKLFGYNNTVNFFESVGLRIVTDSEKRAYPMSNTSASVLDALRLEAENLGVEFVCDTKVESVKTQANGFMVNGGYLCNRIILCAGGKASPVHGSDGSGFTLAEKLGHSVTPLYPSLVQITTDPKIPKQLKGIRCSARVSLLIGGNNVKQTFGEILFTDYGVSGIAAMELSRAVSVHFAKKPANYADCEISLDLVPDVGTKELIGFLLKYSSGRKASIDNLLSGVVPKRLGYAIIKRSLNISAEEPLNTLTHSDIEKAVACTKDFRLTVTGTKDFSSAQVTAGGVNVSEINSETMESKLTPGLYFSGEIIDIDGSCGGYNLQWAWSSGRLAGLSAASRGTDKIC